MRRKFSLDISADSLDRGMILIYGAYGVGKTYLVADFLKHYSEQGPVRFLNVRGEDGHLSAQSFSLGAVGETVESYKEMVEALAEYKKEGIIALGIDSLKPAAALTMAEVLGTDSRLPEITKGGPNEWGLVHHTMALLASHIRSVCPWVMCTCPADKSVDQLDGRTYLTPDLPGREARDSTGWFDFVGYLSADIQAQGVVRKVKFAGNTTTTARARLPKLMADVRLPDEKGGWNAILDAINTILKESNKK